MPQGTGTVERSRADKAVTFTGAAGAGANASAIALFTVAGGLVRIHSIIGRVTTSLTVSNALATISLGVVGSTALFIPLTVANTLLTTAPVWTSITAATGGALIATVSRDTAVVGNIQALIGGAGDVTAGVISITVEWEPITPGATLVSA